PVDGEPRDWQRAQQSPQLGLLLGEGRVFEGPQHARGEAALDLLEHRQLGAVARAADVEARDDAPLGRAHARRFVEEYELVARARPAPPSCPSRRTSRRPTRWGA